MADSKIKPGKLYIVSVPIGNAQDLSPRARSIVEQQAGLIAAEDTRRTKAMFANIRAPLLSYHDHSSQSVRTRIIETLVQGTDVALVSDAGTPTVADPGYRLVTAAVAAGIAVSPVPGPSALLAALTVSALPGDVFHFVGYLDRLPSHKLRAASQWGGTLAGFVPARLMKPVVARLRECYDREHQIVVCRELTKTYESIWRGSLSDLAEQIETVPLKGEIVLLLAPRNNQKSKQNHQDAAQIVAALTAEGVSRSRAAAAVAKVLKVAKKDLYKGE